MKICFLPDNLCTKPQRSGQSLLEISLAAGVDHTHACGGVGKCSTCRVMVLEGAERLLARNPTEQALAQRLGFGPEIRLACQTVPQGDLTLRRLVIDDEDLEILHFRLTASALPKIGVEKELAILFVDLRNFTPFSEALPAYDVMHLLERFFFLCGQQVKQAGGWIDNYMGDGFLALFDGENPKQKCQKALAAAQGVLAAMPGFNHYLAKVAPQFLKLGIGVHYGHLIQGEIGAGEQMREIVIGDAVNTASRIESATKVLGRPLLVSEEVREHLGPEFRFERVGEVTLKGKQGLFPLFCPVE
ncbi:MAG: hypothetical protein A2600_10305 [Candidatus Lambdaproteobacteria bacterium RIFOXYD1_FULL_56_27]|uniref:Guanylate cyclase domain-containing protein n=1 Tax=Candidatus Lambdaproteobacteria bacterium RIFOXYD2_FULL_56_26 TaxID=1817773 RepID=A0A1F6GQT9_9PROT|nr:MAG: hypothetical protein A2557_09380 [Candidatus Lambdaproteobacteria bacterium RIFOXYD2_FULL_56_26]OGH04142.1 MAG: hypothetical protein A2426_02770 [Candidatus Lambdaproteobacteria bacterium RIFOXYC1_FULL_56_13]OGH06341.1 MAG: hypothetical protein A2600_10305 [Candidatus Lambdaproteobacteria bacterium RIFOXYD1_FULL_56_27]